MNKLTNFKLEDTVMKAKTSSNSKKTRKDDSLKDLIGKTKTKSSLEREMNDFEDSTVSLGDGFNAFDLDFYQIQNLN